MRNSTGCTSTSAKKSQQNAVIVCSEEKNSAKKLVQARLPFKVIAPGSSPSDGGHTPAGKNEEGSVQSTGSLKESIDGRKRKLSYSSDSDEKSKDKADNISKENVEVQVAATKKKKTAATKIEAEIISLLDDDEIIDAKGDHEVVQKVSTSTSKAKISSKNIQKTPVENEKRKGAGTPKLTTPKSHKEKSGSATKLQIKLPLSAGKKSKRRKSKVNTILANTSLNISEEKISCAESSDDIEEVSNELNPNKRSKMELTQTENNTYSTFNEKSESKDSQSKIVTSPNTNDLNKVINEKLRSKNSSESETTRDKINCSITNEPEKSEEEQNESIIIASDDNDDDKDTNAEEDEDADDETENKCGDVKGIITFDGNDKDSNAKENSTSDSLMISDKHKSLTPKQRQLMERRQMARLEKERKLLEEKQKKQQEKEEKESARKREREEKEDQKRKEREEKEEQRRKEREEKERKRLAEIEAKNEEKRRKNEAKEEELRKKEDERKRKEIEKEEVELKKKKAAQAFTKFFVAKTTPSGQQSVEVDENTGDGIKSLAFRPFQIKGDMKLAPICRNALTSAAKSRLESFIGCSYGSDGNNSYKISNDFDSSQASKLYINELKSGHIIPGKWRRPSTESNNDVVIVEDELERVGQEIIEDTPAYVREEMRVKFYKFHDNRRPAYYGTFRKKSKIVSGRKPFAQDTKFFDYEVDSDDEWEEEEPGESLEDGSDDDKEKESEDEDYEVDNEWFVPHGHLSEEELQNEDECGLGDDNTREAQKAKLQLIQQEFAQEMKKKTEKIKPRLIGCIWANANGTPPQECPTLIWETLGKRSMLYSDPPVVEEPKVEEPVSPTGPSVDKLKPIKLSDEMTKDLVRLVHGNNNSKNFLIKEYIAYLEKTEESIKNGEFCNIAKSAIREKIESFAEWQVVDRSPSSETSNDNVNRKKKNKKRLCWVVSSEVLDKMDMSSMNLNNTWEYTLNPKRGLKTEDPLETLNELITKSDKAEDKAKTLTGTTQITKYTKSLTDEEKVKKLQHNELLICSSAEVTPETQTKKENKTKLLSSQTSKEKKRVPLLISMARGQQMSTPAKNKLISQFLHKGKKDSNNSSTMQEPKTTELDDDDVVILD